MKGFIARDFKFVCYFMSGFKLQINVSINEKKRKEEEQETLV